MMIYYDMSVLADSLPGEVAEWSNALDLKSSEPKGSVSSNLTLSVELFVRE